MSTIKPFTQFPVFNFPTKFIPFAISRSYLSFHHPCSFSSSEILHPLKKKSAKFPVFSRRRKKMNERGVKIHTFQSEDGEEGLRVLEQDAFVDGSSDLRSNFASREFEAVINRLSKWLVALTFGVVLLLRHDAEAVWAAMGSVLNTVLSIVLKRILNQERPVGNLRADPGMPSSHAQSIFFIVPFVILSMVEWLGVNEVTVIFAASGLAIGSYFSWLRVAQNLHTIDQVAVGAVVGFGFSLVWLWSWHAVVFDAFNSELWVQVSIVLASAVCCLGFLIYVIRYWLRDDR